MNRSELNRYLVGRRANQQFNYILEKLMLPLLNVKRLEGFKELS